MDRPGAAVRLHRDYLADHGALGENRLGDQPRVPRRVRRVRLVARVVRVARKAWSNVRLACCMKLRPPSRAVHRPVRHRQLRHHYVEHSHRALSSRTERRFVRSVPPGRVGDLGIGSGMGLRLCHEGLPGSQQAAAAMSEGSG